MNEQEQDKNSKRLDIGRTIIKAIAEHDEEFYEEYIEKYTQYPDEEAPKYEVGYDNHVQANYDDDVDIAEMNAIIDILSYVVTNHHPHKVVTTEGGEE